MKKRLNKKHFLIIVSAIFVTIFIFIVEMMNQRDSKSNDFQFIEKTQSKEKSEIGNINEKLNKKISERLAEKPLQKKTTVKKLSQKKQIDEKPKVYTHPCSQITESLINDHKDKILLRVRQDSSLDWLYGNTPFTEDLPAKRAEDYFYRGLYHGGLLDAEIFKSEQVNFEDALLNLEKAHELDPSNSAILLYMAIIYQELDNTEKVEEHIKKAIQKNMFFNSYLTEIAKRVLSKVETEEEVFAAFDINGFIGIPNYSKILDLTRGKSSAPLIGAQLMDQGNKAKRKRDFIDFILIEYLVGWNINNIANGPKAKYSKKQIQELFKKERELDSVYYNKYYENCQPSELKGLIEIAKP